MNDQEVRAAVTEYRRLSGLVRAARARQRFPWSRSRALTYHHEAKTGIVAGLTRAGRADVARLLDAWHDKLTDAARIHASDYEARQHRAQAREIAAQINAAIGA